MEFSSLASMAEGSQSWNLVQIMLYKKLKNSKGESIETVMQLGHLVYQLFMALEAIPHLHWSQELHLSEFASKGQASF